MTIERVINPNKGQLKSCFVNVTRINIGFSRI